MGDYPRLMTGESSVQGGVLGGVQGGVLAGAMTALAGAGPPAADLTGLPIRRRRYARGETLFRQGDADGELRAVAGGYIKLIYEDEAGRAFTKSILEPGDVFASIRALRGAPASFGAVALTETVVEQTPWTALDRLAAASPAVERAIRALLLDYGARKEMREFELLTLTPQVRWRRLLTTRPHLATALPQSELAALIGVTPVALSRMKRRVEGVGRR